MRISSQGVGALLQHPFTFTSVFTCIPRPLGIQSRLQVLHFSFVPIRLSEWVIITFVSEDGHMTAELNQLPSSVLLFLTECRCIMYRSS